MDSPRGESGHVPKVQILPVEETMRPKCKHCGGDLYERLERITEICTTCYESDAEIELECEEAWTDYINERYDSVEANQ